MRPHILARRLAILQRPLPNATRCLSSRAQSLRPRGYRPLLFDRSQPARKNRNYAKVAEKEAEIEADDTLVSVPVPGAAKLQEDLNDIRIFLDEQIGGSSIWRDRIRAVSEDLQSVRRGRIAVVGEPLAAPQDVVSAMLQDPLNHSVESVTALRSRHQSPQPSLLRITQAGSSSAVGVYSVDSPFLQNAGYDMMEISPDADDIPSLLSSADAVVVVIDPIRLLDGPLISSFLPALLSGHPLHIVINGGLPYGVTETALEGMIHSRIDQWLADSGFDTDPSYTPARVFCVQADKANQAVDLMTTAAALEPSSSSSHARAISAFQKAFSESNIGPLLSSLVRQCQNLPSPQLSSAYRIASLALDYARSVIIADRRTTDSAARTVADLRRSAEQSTSRARHMSVVTKGIEGGIVAEGMETEMSALKLEMQDRFRDRWSWLALVLRLKVDDIGSEVGDYIQRFMGAELARRITFETGELAQLQRQLGGDTDRIVHQLSSQHGKIGASQPFFSPLLINSLSTLSLSVPSLSPTSLTDPIESRREQVLATSVPRLQTSATRILLSSWILTGAAASLSWTAYMPPLSLLSAPTALGLGILSAVASVSLGQRSWLRAQNRFWRDWDRINGMLRGDMEARLNTVIDTQVAAKPHAAADGLEQLVAKRQRRLDDLQSRVGAMQARLYPTSS